jgi:predicted nucleic acid-binding protein
MILLLDTTVLIDALRNRTNLLARLSSLVLDGHVLTTSTANLAEVYAGMRPTEERETVALFQGLHCYPVTEGIAQLAGKLKYQWALRGRTLSLIDMIVAATALENGAALITDNRKDFPVHGLRFHPLP